MKKTALLLSLSLILSTSSMWAKDKEKNNKETSVYQFTDIKRIDVTPVRNQNKSGTCWSFSANSMIEAEMLRVGKPAVHLSEMFTVRKTYEDKAISYVRMHGNMGFGAGNEANNVRDVIAKYGTMPESAYSGLQYGETKHDHAELDRVLKAYLDAVISGKKLTSAWFKGYSAILDTYLGVVPQTFEWEGTTYTAKSYADQVVGLNMNDYLLLSSFTYAPVHDFFTVEVPDNWAWTKSFNLTLDEMIETIDNSINNGYTITWGADVSEKGFSWRNGIAIVPDGDAEDLSGSERDKWEKLTSKEKEDKLYSFKEIVPERKITAEERERAFENYETTDDHGMLICGIAKDQKGNKYYIVKNSWDTTNVYKGYFYASEAYVRYKTMSIMVHRKAIPESIAKMIK